MGLNASALCPRESWLTMCVDPLAALVYARFVPILTMFRYIQEMTFATVVKGTGWRLQPRWRWCWLYATTCCVPAPHLANILVRRVWLSVVTDFAQRRHLRAWEKVTLSGATTAPYVSPTPRSSLTQRRAQVWRRL